MLSLPPPYRCLPHQRSELFTQRPNSPSSRAACTEFSPLNVGRWQRGAAGYFKPSAEARFCGVHGCLSVGAGCCLIALLSPLPRGLLHSSARERSFGLDFTDTEREWVGGRDGELRSFQRYEIPTKFAGKKSAGRSCSIYSSSSFGKGRCI